MGMLKMFKILIYITISMIFLNQSLGFAMDDLKGWQNTRWGMSREELKNAIGDKLKKDNKGWLYMTNYQIGKFTFYVEFSFPKDRDYLTFVGVSPDPSCKIQDCDNVFLFLKKALISKYGPPINIENSHSGLTHTWIFTSTTIKLIYAKHWKALLLRYDEIESSGKSSGSPEDKL
jgi:hypothetical protein